MREEREREGGGRGDERGGERESVVGLEGWMLEG